MFEKRGLLTDREKVVFSLGVLSLVLFSGIVGDIISTMLTTLLILLGISFFYELMLEKSFNRNLIININERIAILSCSLFITTIFVVVLPYILFHDAILNLFIIQYIYLFPLLFIFFFTAYVFSHWVKMKPMTIVSFVKKTLLITFVLSLVISVGIVGVKTYSFNLNSVAFHIEYQNTLNQLELVGNDLNTEEYPIFDDIHNFWESKIKVFSKIKSNHNKLKPAFCLNNSCVRIIFDQTYDLFEIVVQSHLFANTLNVAQKEVTLLEKKKYAEKYYSLENYSLDLQQKVDALNINVDEYGSYGENFIINLDSDFNYNFILNSNHLYQQDQVGGLSSFFLVSNSDDSLLDKSLEYVALHSDVGRNYLRMVLKVITFADIQDTNSDLFVTIFNNRYVNESIESKIIRNKIILDVKDQNKD